MPQVAFKPSGLTREVLSGKSLFDAAREAGLPVASSCDGDFVCGKCNMQVVAGGDALSPQTEEERGLLRREKLPLGDRISCKTQVHGDCAVTTRYW